MRILIVDDKSENLYLLEVLLKSAGYEVVTAKNGIEALENLRSNRFDGIVSDILMPRMDGFKLIRECKNDPVFRQIPFIFYTATYLEQKDEEFGRSLGAIRYIIKPSKPEELLRQIHEVFLEYKRSPRDYTTEPVPDEVTFNREYTRRVGAKLDKKIGQLKESEEKYQLLFENSMDAILLTSPDGGIQAVNHAACAMFQQTEEEILKKGRDLVVDSADPRLALALEERARTGRVKGELTFLRKGGTRFPGEISSNIFTDRSGQTRTSMIIRDISERKQAEEAIRESEDKYRTVFENTGTAMLVVEENDIISLANAEFTKLSGFSKDDIEKKKSWTEFIVKEDLEQMLAQHRLRMQNPKKALLHYEFRFVTKSGDIRNIYLTIDVIPGTKKSVASLLDITERKQSEKALFENEKFLTNIVEQIPDMIFVKDAQDLRFVRFNKAGEDLLGYSREEMLGKNDHDFFPKSDADFFTDKDKEVINKNQLLDISDEKIQTRYKGERILHTKKIPIVDEHGHPKYLLGISEDITERKKAEEQLKHFSEDLEKQVAERTGQLNKSLQEKEILLKEIHHRVKNNMQIITSLLNLQARTIDDPEVLKTIKESQSRIRAMALVHERLYQSGDISTIDLKDYIQFLGRELFSFYGVKSQLIRFTINAPVIKVNINTAIPLGLIVNELLSNAMKYAFPEGRKGEIVIEITKDKNTLSLVVRDNGVGIPADFDWQNAKSLGIRLVNSLVEQLQGTIETDRSEGTTFKIVVKEKE